MRKVIHKIYIALLAAFLMAGLGACDREPGTTDDYMVSEPVRLWTIEELGETIVAAGTFWEDWWQLSGRFTHIDWDGSINMPEHLVEERGLGMFALLSTSGFESIDDIRNHLLQYYTEAWADAELSRDFAIFVEYDDVLYVDGTRAGFARPNWNNATHVLVEQEGSRAVVETTFLHGAWHRGYEYAYPVRAIYRFTFIDGKIDAGLGPWGHSEDIVFEALP